jgi:electron transport complex protein RnfD
VTQPAALTAPTKVLIALAPGAVVQAALLGDETLANIAIAAATAAALESMVARLRGEQPLSLLRDGSAGVTAMLIALCLPPHTPAGVVIVGVLIGLGIGKHVYGGAGNNPFNPAMVGYAALLLSFPGYLSAWPSASAVDAVTAPTALDVLAHRGGHTIADIWSPANGFGTFGGAQWEWLNAAYLAGGVVLVVLRLVDWRIPLTILASIAILAAAFYDAGSSASMGSPLFHWFSGGTMLGAFFVATDPATCPTTARGRVWFALLIGIALFVIRTGSAYPDGIAFAILLGNASAPLIDRLSVNRPRPVADP